MYAHDEDTRATNMTVFPNARQIYFINNKDFLNKRITYRDSVDVEWQTTN